MLPWWAQVIVAGMVLGMAAWGVWGFASALRVLQRARTPGERAGARLHAIILGVRLALVVAVIGMLAWTLLRG